jgi:alpha-galactosidase
LLCEKPRLPAWPVYGGNDWYYAYGKNTHQGIIGDSRIVAELSPKVGNRPYMVIDGGWNDRDSVPCWEHGNDRFPDMPGLAAAMHAQGVRPGIHYRPLDATPADPESLLLPDSRFTVVMTGRHPVMDPSIPEVLERIHGDIRRFVDWGYEMVKHDFSTVDIFGHWGYQMD